MKFTDSIAFLKEVADLDISSDISGSKIEIDDVWQTPDNKICSTKEAIEHFNTYGEDVATFEPDENSSLSLKDQFIAFLEDNEEGYKSLSEDAMFKIAAQNLDRVG